MRCLWLAQLVSQIGDWFNMIALFQVIVALGGSSEAVGLVLIIHSLPAFVLSPVAGFVADRLDRRRILIVTDLLRIVLVLAYLPAIHRGELWLVFVIMTLHHSASAFFEPAKQALLPAYATGAELVTANALNGVTWSTTNAIGSLLGGIAVANLGLESVFVLDALTFAVSAVLLVNVAAKQAKDGPGRKDEGAAASPRLFASLRGEPMLAVATAAKSVMALFGGGYWVLLVLIGQHVFPMGQNGSISVGLLNGTMALGALLGASFATRAFGRASPRNGRDLAWMFTARGLLLVVFALSPNIWFACVLAIANTALGACIYVGSTNLMHILSEERIRGRLFSLDLGSMTLAYAISVEAVGKATDDLGFSIMGVTLALALFALAIGVAWFPVAMKWATWFRSRAHRGPGAPPDRG